MANKFYRHFRPQFFDRNIMGLRPASRGGVSFLFAPRDEGVYDYWIYVCPTDARFSAAAATAKLNLIEQQGIKPWGTITKSEQSILSEAIEDILKESNELPTTVSHLVLEFVLNNLQEETKKSRFISQARNAVVHYEN